MSYKFETIKESPPYEVVKGVNKYGSVTWELWKNGKWFRTYVSEESARKHLKQFLLDGQAR